MASSSTSKIDAAAVADMESELQQLRLINKELRSTVDSLTKTNKTNTNASKMKQKNNGRERNLSVDENVADGSYKLYSTPNHTPKPADDDDYDNDEEEKSLKLIQGAFPSLNEIEMGTVVSQKSQPKQKVKKKTDGGGNYSRASSRGDEEEPSVRLVGSDYDSDEQFIDDDSHNKHTSRKRNNNGLSSTALMNNAAHTFPPFAEAIRERAGWLIGLLFLQSCSSFIIAYNEKFLQTHMVIVQFLTMLVGAGGNAGNQAAVGVIRGLAIGTVNGNTWRAYLRHEAKMAVGLSCLIGLTGFIRAAMFRTPWGETIAITLSVFIIVVTSVAIGSTLPLAMKKVGIDPAHSSTTIQVIMDILGVLITVMVSAFIMSFAVFQTDEDNSIDDTTYKMNTADVAR